MAVAAALHTLDSAVQSVVDPRVMPGDRTHAAQIRKNIYTYTHRAASLRTRILSRGSPVHRLTINLPPELHAALKAAAARRGTTLGSRGQESLEAYGIKPERDVRELVAAARARSGLPADEAERLALEETRAARNRNRWA